MAACLASIRACCRSAIAFFKKPAMLSRIAVIGFLSAESRDLFTDRLRVFLKGLSESGYGVGQNVAIEFRWAVGQYDQLPALAADLVGRQVTLGWLA